MNESISKKIQEWETYKVKAEADLKYWMDAYEKNPTEFVNKMWANASQFLGMCNHAIMVLQKSDYCLERLPNVMQGDVNRE